MIHGHKPSSYFVTFDGEGRKIEGECRQCVHCQYTWEYHPGSGVQRGYCLECGGFVCARPECFMEQVRRVDEYLAKTGQRRHCIPFDEWNERLREKIEKLLPLDPGFMVTESGLVIPVPGN